MNGEEWETEFKAMPKDELDKFINMPNNIPLVIFREFIGLDTVMSIAIRVAHNRGIIVIQK